MTLFVILVALNVVDVYLTLKILKRGGRELNPIMRVAMERLGQKQALIGVKLLVLGALYLVLPQVPEWALWGLIGIYVLVVAHNARQ